MGGCQGPGRQEGRDCEGCRVSFGGGGNILELDSGDGCTTL